jgi:hypothetical protein
VLTKISGQFNDDLPSEDEEFDGMNFGDRGDDAMDEDDYENDTEGVYKTLSDILDEQEEADHGRHWDLVDKIRGMGTGDSNKKRKLNDITQVRPENVWGVRWNFVFLLIRASFYVLNLKNCPAAFFCVHYINCEVVHMDLTLMLVDRSVVSLAWTIC